MPLVVLDTGLAPDHLGGTISPRIARRAPEPFGPTRYNPRLTPPFAITDNVDEPDANQDRFLDPTAGHGTFIAGLLARLAPDSNVSLGKVLESTGEGDDATLAWRVWQLVKEQAGILVLSCGGYTDNDEPTPALQAAIAAVRAKGWVVVASAGNDATCRPSFPAALPGVIAVGALGTDGPADFTNYGAWVSACAPGVDVVASFYHGVDREDDGDPATEDFNGSAAWDGTSFAAPIVAAAIARECSLYGITPIEAVERVIHDRRLFRIPNLGTVVNLH